MSIHVNLEVPTNVRIDFGFRPRLPRDRNVKRLVVEQTVREVQRALQQWYYETYC
jgi:hypothetical protein